MLLTNSNSVPVSTGCIIANCLLAATILTPVSTCSYVHLKVKEKFSTTIKAKQKFKDRFQVHVKESTKFKDKDRKRKIQSQHNESEGLRETSKDV